MEEITFYTVVPLEAETIALYRNNMPAGMLRVRTTKKDEWGRYLVAGTIDKDLHNFDRNKPNFFIIG